MWQRALLGGRNVRPLQGFPLGNPGEGDRKIIQATVAISRSPVFNAVAAELKQAVVIDFATGFLNPQIPIAVASGIRLIPGGINPMGKDLLAVLEGTIEGLERANRDSKRPDPNRFVETLLTEADRQGIPSGANCHSYAIVGTAAYTIRSWMLILARGIWIAEPLSMIRASPEDHSAALPPFERAAIAAITALKLALSPASA